MATVSDLAYLERKLNDRIQRSKELIEEFKTNLDKGPAYAFEWADGIMMRAAEMEVATRVLSEINFLREAHPSMKDDEMFGHVKVAVNESFFRLAGRVSRSTSPTTNVMADNMRQAWFEMHTQLS